MALGMVAATVGCGDDSGSTDGGVDKPKTDAGGSGGKADAAGSGGIGGGSGGTGGNVNPDAGDDGGSTPQMLWSFDNGVDGFMLNQYDTSAGNLVLPENRPDGGAAPTMDWVADAGISGGALRLTATFSDVKQKAPLRVDVNQDWAGKKLRVRFKLEGSVDPSLANAVLQIWAQDAANGYWPPLGTAGQCKFATATGWTDCVTDLSKLATASVTQVTIQIATPDAPVSAGVPPTGDVSILFDDISLE